MKSLFLINWTARGRPELVLPVFRSRSADVIVLPGVGVEVFVLQHLPHSPVNLIGARLQVHVHHAPGGAAILRVVAAGEHLHLANRFGRRPDHESGPVQKVDDVHVVVDAVQQEVVFAERTDAVHRHAAGSGIAAGFPRHHSRREPRKIGEYALSAQRQLGHLRRVQLGA